MAVLDFIILHLFYRTIEHIRRHLGSQLVVNTSALVETKVKQGTVKDDGEQDASSTKNYKRPHLPGNAPHNSDNAENKAENWNEGGTSDGVCQTPHRFFDRWRRRRLVRCHGLKLGFVTHSTANLIVVILQTTIITFLHGVLVLGMMSGFSFCVWPSSSNYDAFDFRQSA